MTRAERRERKARAARRAKMNVPLRLRIPDEMHEGLLDVAIEKRMTRAELVREAVATFLKKQAA